MLSCENLKKIIYELSFRTNETFRYIRVSIFSGSVHRAGFYCTMAPHSQRPCSGHCRHLELVSSSLTRAVKADFYLTL